MNNKIISDGCNEQDLKAVSIKSMQFFLDRYDQDDTFESLYNEVIAKIDDLIAEPELEDDSVAILTEEYKLLTAEDKIKFVQAITEVKEEPITKEVIKETPHAIIKKGGRPKKVKEGSNIEGTEGTGSRG